MGSYLGTLNSDTESEWGGRTGGNHTEGEKEEGEGEEGEWEGEEEGHSGMLLYIQMEYCPRTLRQVLDSGPIPPDLCWRLFRQVVEGLGHIHSQTVIHRDLTPNNVFFDARGDIKIGDFGLGTPPSPHHHLIITSS